MELIVLKYIFKCKATQDIKWAKRKNWKVEVVPNDCYFELFLSFCSLYTGEKKTIQSILKHFIHI